MHMKCLYGILRYVTAHLAFRANSTMKQQNNKNKRKEYLKILAGFLPAVVFFGSIAFLIFPNGECTENARRYPYKVFPNRATLILLGLPKDGANQDIIEFGLDRAIYRSTIPRINKYELNAQVISDDLWQEVENVRLQWCKEPPMFVNNKPLETDYYAVVKCGCAKDPKITIPPHNLPTAFRSLIWAIPPK
jgi:hypothetical protein